MIDIIEELDALRARVGEWKGAGLRVGFVPTMGNLHAGHHSLVRLAREHSDRVVASVFVNPTQFGPDEDFGRYPRTPEQDAVGLAAAGCDALWLPTVATMYPHGAEATVQVRVPGVTAVLEGEHRPGHLDGVETVVARLFHQVQPDVAVFGRKDYQQLMVIRRLVRDLLLPVEVVGIPTVRESDGLALSSRNMYLSPEDRRRAAEIPRALAEAARAFEAGERRAGTLVAGVRARLARISDRIDYIDVAEPESLRVLGAEEHAGERALLALALRVGTTRLIDNLVLGEDGALRVGDASPGPASASAEA